MVTQNLQKSPGLRQTRKFGPVILVILVANILAGCSSQTIQATQIPLPTSTPIVTITARPTSTIPATSLPPTNTSSPTSTVHPTVTATTPTTITPTMIPTYKILRGVVNEEHVMCFYGPSKAYLYKYGLLGGNRLEIIGILRDTGYIKIRAIGGTNPCWMNMKFMDIQGDQKTIPTVDPLDIKLPRSPYYGVLNSVNATRNGNEVTISWSPLELRTGDDSEQEPYLVETWVCQKGSIVFIPFGVYDTELKVVDEPGCGQESFGRVYGVEKHGYTPYLKIQWPAALE